MQLSIKMRNKIMNKIKTFQDYVSLKELAAYDIGTDILGKSSLDDDSQKALTAAIQAFEIIMSKNSQVAVQFLNRMSEVMPEIKSVLQQHGLDSFKDAKFKTDVRRGAGKGRRYVAKGLADVSPDDVKNHGTDVLATNSADSFHNPIG
jgi:hypothetical protein